MSRLGFLFFILHLSSYVFSQPNNGVNFINNLPNMIVGQSMEIIIDGNGGGGISIVVDNLEGTHNCAIERWELINGNWIMTNTTINNTVVTWLSGQKMIARAISSQGNNPCSSHSGEDNILGNDFGTGVVDKIICITSQVLPLFYLNHPSAKLHNNKTQITWSVATQINNEKYIIEYSKDGRNFSPIGEIAGDGTSNIIKHYEYIHTSPSIGMNYYRIKQVDYDGKYSYSDIASVRYDGNGETKIFPNPTTSEVNVTTTVQTTLEIMDMYGRLLINQPISEGQNIIHLAELPIGLLIFVVGDQRCKVLKE